MIKSDYYDVLVIGEGLSGFAAGITCARAGLSVLLAGARPVLGWEATWALRNRVENPHNLGHEIADAVAAAGAFHNGILDPTVLELVLDDMAAQADMSVLYFVRPVCLLVRDQAIRGAVLAGKSGEIELRARAVVDATHRAAAWHFAGENPHSSPPRSLHFGLVMNGAGGLEGRPELITEGELPVRVESSAWPGQVQVRFEVPAADDVTDAQMAVPEVVRTVRQQVLPCADALVTQMAFDAVPAYSERPGPNPGTTHPHLKGLYGAGPWSSAGEDAGSRGFDGLVALGEKVGKDVAESVDGMADPTGKAERLEPSTEELHADVVVCGGGTAGTMAAFAAATEGVETLLIESTAALGGIGTAGNIHGYYYGISGGRQDALDALTEDLTPLLAGAGSARGFHPVARWLATLTLLRDAGVRIRTSATVFDVETQPDTGDDGQRARIRSVRAVGPAGPLACRAAVYIDSTGDADVAAMAGVPFRYGRTGDGALHPYSLSAERLEEEGRMGHLNFDAGYCDPDDVFDLTRARRHALQYYRRERYSADDRLLFIAPQVGVRQGRQVVGDYTLTLGDETLERSFDDLVAYAASNYDNHARDYASESDEAAVYVWLLGKHRDDYGCEVPYRCLLPRGAANLLVACRGLSVTQDAHYQLRMMRDMQRIGEAAGVAAALCRIIGCDPRQLPVCELQERLFASGALGPPDADRSPGTPLALHNPGALPPPPPKKSLDEWLKELSGENPRTAVWMIIQAGESAVPDLLDAVRSGHEEERFWASVPLAMQLQREAVPALLQAVRTRRSNRAQGRHSAPAWMAAIVLLGRLRAPDAVPLLVDVLSEPDAPLDAYVAALRALGRIGDAQAAPAVRNFLKRDDLDTRQNLAGSPWQGPVFADVRWRVALAAAAALAQMGERDVRDIVAPYLEDDRRPVRRRARAVLELATEEPPAG